MGKYRGGPKPWEKNDAQGRRLDPGQYPELNATFYTARPAEFVNMRINVLSLIACTEEQLAPAFGADRKIGAALSFGGMAVPHEEERQRYIQTEAMMLVHHASEALLHLYFAHVEHPECPWLGMASSTDFRAFKAKINDSLVTGFKQDDVATVFLSGVSPEDAGIELSQEEFDDAIAGVDRLLWDCALRVLGDPFLYNAVKHGLSAIAIDDDQARFEWVSDDGQRITLHRGATHAYLHRQRRPGAKRGEKEWFLSMEDSNPQRDLAVARYIATAIGSLWGVAQRRYLGRPSSILCLTKAAVEMAIYGPVEESLNVLKRMTSELIKLKPDGEVDGTEHDIEAYRIPDDWKAQEGTECAKSMRVRLPVRPQDRRVLSTSSRAYLPITPKGFQRG
jgi:hypothetical protein